MIKLNRDALREAGKVLEKKATQMASEATQDMALPTDPSMSELLTVPLKISGRMLVRGTLFPALGSLVAGTALRVASGEDHIVVLLDQLIRPEGEIIDARAKNPGDIVLRK